MTLKRSKLYKCRRTKNGSIAELGPAIFILFFLCMIPLLNLLWIGCTYSIIALAANTYVSAAAVETSYDRSLAATYASANQFNKSVWSIFSGISPEAGYGNSGVDLFIKSTAIGSHQMERFGPNVAAPYQVSSDDRVWEFEAKVAYQVNPLMNLSSVPLLGDIPGLGRSVILQYSSYKSPEHPQSVMVAQSNSNVYGQQPVGSLKSSMPVSGTGGGGVLPGGTAWTNPGIYQMIQAAGQTVVTEDVLIVPGTAENWVETGITVNPGEKVWIDLRSDGKWSYGKTHDLVSADGYTGYKKKGASAYLGDFVQGILVGQIGASDPFEVGQSKLNLAPVGTGPLKLIMNDFYWDGRPAHEDNRGQQMVRIIVTK